MVELNNFVATSVVLTTATYVKPGMKPAKNAGKNYFPNRFPPDHETSTAKSFIEIFTWDGDEFRPVWTWTSINFLQLLTWYRDDMFGAWFRDEMICFV